MVSSAARLAPARWHPSYSAHLVHPLPCLTAAHGTWLRSRTAFRLALTINDLVGFDRNADLPASHRVPRSRTLNRCETLSLYPGWDKARWA